MLTCPPLSLCRWKGTSRPGQGQPPHARSHLARMGWSECACVCCQCCSATPCIELVHPSSSPNARAIDGCVAHGP
eukprot:15472895-Alexandrium_andersonii.AAC.1